MFSAILSDVTTPANRSKALAYVGIAFAICFCIGPPIGAIFSQQPLPSSVVGFGYELNVYAGPAILTLILLSIETLFLMVFLPETRGKSPRPTQTEKEKEKEKEKASAAASPKKSSSPAPPKISRKQSVEKRIALLKRLGRLHFAFLALFSGMEFTLTFLTFDCKKFYSVVVGWIRLTSFPTVFDWNNRQNGALIGSIGIISALLQGGYVRRAMSKVGEGKMARRGVASCAIGLVFLALLPEFAVTKPDRAPGLLQGACICFAFTSATVVNALTAYASLQCDEGGFNPETGKETKEHPQLAKGKALGKFRSSGQLGRAIGPLLGKPISLPRQS
jgi:hypothetical protein